MPQDSKTYFIDILDSIAKIKLRHMLTKKRQLSKETLRVIQAGKKEVQKNKGLSLQQVKEALAL